MPRTSAFGYGFESKQILEIGEASFKDGCRPRVAHSKIEKPPNTIGSSAALANRGRNGVPKRRNPALPTARIGKRNCSRSVYAHHTS